MTIVTKLPDFNALLLNRISVAATKLGSRAQQSIAFQKEGTLVLAKIDKRSTGITATSIAAMFKENKVSR